MKTIAEKETTLLNNIVVTENPELDRTFGKRIFFPEKNKLADEQVQKHGLPKELTKAKVAD